MKTIKKVITFLAFCLTLNSVSCLSIENQKTAEVDENLAKFILDKDVISNLNFNVQNFTTDQAIQMLLDFNKVPLTVSNQMTAWTASVAKSAIFYVAVFGATFVALQVIYQFISFVFGYKSIMMKLVVEMLTSVQGILTGKNPLDLGNNNHDGGRGLRAMDLILLADDVFKAIEAYSNAE